MWVANMITHINKKGNYTYVCVSQYEWSIVCWMNKNAKVMEAGVKWLVLARFFSKLHGCDKLIVDFFSSIIMNYII